MNIDHTIRIYFLVALRGSASNLTADQQRHIVLMIGEREYKTEQTLPTFANQHLKPRGFQCTLIHADKTDPNRFPGIDVLKDADLLLVSVRRRTLTDEQMQLVRAHLSAGKPLMGIRTASHAFSLRRGEPPAGHVQWQNFDIQVLGARYDGHYRNTEGTEVTTELRAEQHEILTGIRDKSFRSGGTLYKSLELSSGTEVLLRGFTKENGQPIQMPVAWTNRFGKSRVFYTSLDTKQNSMIPRLLTC